ncbi:MAG: hypothetical protein KF857_12695 [Fimbriimonadaceae bacterium]|nr:hypothetical protein [Fimbriimonadaceae bacterium]
MASCVRQLVVVALSVVVMAPAAMAQDPVKTYLSAPDKARQVAAEESRRAYKGDEDNPGGNAVAFSPEVQKRLAERLAGIEKKFGVTFSTKHPFENAAALKANMAKPAWSMDELVGAVRPDPKGAGLKCVGRAVNVEGTVLSVEKQAHGRTVTVGDPSGQSDHIAAFVVDDSCKTPFAVGDHFSGMGVFLLQGAKKGEAQDMYMFAYVPESAQAGGPAPAAAASPTAEPKGEFTDVLKGWRLVGVVSDEQGAVGVFVNKDGAKKYCRTGQKLDEGIYLKALVDGQARLKVGKKTFDVWPW